VVLVALGTDAALIGLLLLAFNGYVEDAGTEPFHTLPFALPVLVLAAVLFGLGGRTMRHAEPREIVLKLFGGVGLGLALGVLAVLAIFGGGDLT
jgi:hypothetical protein